MFDKVIKRGSRNKSLHTIKIKKTNNKIKIYII